MRLVERRAEENLVFVPLLRRKRSYSAGNTWRHRLKRNRISSYPGLRGLRAPACAANPTPASELRPSPAPGPQPGPGAPRWPWGDAAPPRVETELVSGFLGSLLPRPPSPICWGPAGRRLLRPRHPRAPRAPWGRRLGKRAGVSLAC